MNKRYLVSSNIANCEPIEESFLFFSDAIQYLLGFVDGGLNAKRLVMASIRDTYTGKNIDSDLLTSYLLGEQDVDRLLLK